MFDKQQGKCVYCGNVYQYDELQIEHMIPKALGGSDHIRNCQLACRHCNQAKGTMTDIEFRQKIRLLLTAAGEDAGPTAYKPGKAPDVRIASQATV